MKLSYFHLNIEKGEYLDAVMKYIQEKDFDILSFQEVGNKQFSDYEGQDIFQVIKEKLGYEGELAINLRVQNDYDSYFGNATFFKKEMSLIDKKIIWMKDYLEIDNKSTFPFEEYPRNALSLTLKKDDVEFQVINTHLAWSPDALDNDYKVTQGKILYEYVKTLEKPFIFSGDFNVDKNSQIVKWFDTLGRNLAVEHDVKNTLNPNLHKAKHLFPPGLAVDFVYVGNGVSTEKFELVEKDLSDHYGFSVNVEI